MTDDAGPRYLPILKSRQGELKALAELGAMGDPISPDLMPIIEVVEIDFTGSVSDRGKQLSRTAAKIAGAWPPGRPRIAIDAISVEPDEEATSWDVHETVSADPVTPDLIDVLRHHHSVRAVPVIRLSDSPSRRGALGPFLAWADEPGACLRIGTEDLDDQVVPLDQAVDDLLDELGVDPADVDLVLDFGAVDDDHTLAMAKRLARFVLPTLDRPPWRSFALGSGAFPVNLGEVAAYTIAEIPRRDRELWVQLNQLRLRRGLDFSDYAVTHPLLQTGVAFAAPPQIRYTAQDSWLVAKGRRTDRRGHRQFFDLCGRMLKERPSVIAPAGRSWGDAEFWVAAEKAGLEADKPGNASTWRAIATSHHVAHVLHALKMRAEP